MEVNGFELPKALIDAFNDGRWVSRGGIWHDPKDIRTFRSVFPKCSVKPLPSLYGPDSIQRENEDWNSGWEYIDLYLGEVNGEYFPGKIDPDKSVVIGRTEPECPIILNYEYQKDNPSVAYLFYEGDCPYWEQAADDIKDLIRMLGI